MGDRTVKRQGFVLAKRGFAVLSFAFLLGLTFSPYSASALDEPVEPTNPPAEVEAPASAIPTTCTPTEGVTSSWSPLALATASHTNNMNLTWSWSLPTSSNPDATYQGYGYALYYGQNVLANGELSPEVQQYSYAASTEGSYRLYVWILDTTAPVAVTPADPEVPVEPTAPTPTGCESQDTNYDVTPPVINGNTYTQNGKTASPLLSTDEQGLTFSWIVDALQTSATISNSGELNPTFTFLQDGTYTFRLTVTDLAGNTTVVSFTITYLAPFIPTPEAPLPEPIIPAPIDPYIPPAIVVAEAKRTIAVGASYEAVASTDVMPGSGDAAVNSSVAGTQANTDALDTVAATTGKNAVETGSQGWVILGVPWYWWLLGAVIVASAVQWYRSGAFRKRPDDI